MKRNALIEKKNLTGNKIEFSEAIEIAFKK